MSGTKQKQSIKLLNEKKQVANVLNLFHTNSMTDIHAKHNLVSSQSHPQHSSSATSNIANSSSGSSTSRANPPLKDSITLPITKKASESRIPPGKQEEVATPSDSSNDDQESDIESTGSTEESDYDEEDDVDVVASLKRAREKNARSKEAISSLLENIAQYKQVIEEEKAILTKELVEERSISAHLAAENESLKDDLVETIREYESKIKQINVEKNEKNREALQNLEVLFQEIQYIEEKNDRLDVELNESKAQKEEIQIQVEEANTKISRLEQEKDILLKTVQNGRLQKKMIPNDQGSPANRTRLNDSTIHSTNSNSAENSNAPTHSQSTQSSSSLNSSSQVQDQLSLQAMKLRQIAHLVQQQLDVLSSVKISDLSTSVEEGMNRMSIPSRHGSNFSATSNASSSAADTRNPTESQNIRREKIMTMRRTLRSEEAMELQRNGTIDSQSVNPPHSSHRSINDPSIYLPPSNIESKTSSAPTSEEKISSMIPAVTISKARAVLERHLTSTNLPAALKAALPPSPAYETATLKDDWFYQVDVQGRVTYINTASNQQSLLHPALLTSLQTAGTSTLKSPPSSMRRLKDKKKRKEAIKRTKKEKMILKSIPNMEPTNALVRSGSADQATQKKGPTNVLKQSYSLTDVPKISTSSNSLTRERSRSDATAFTSKSIGLGRSVSTPQAPSNPMINGKDLMLAPSSSGAGPDSLAKRRASEVTKRPLYQSIKMSVPSQQASGSSSHSSFDANSPPTTPNEKKERRKTGLFGKLLGK